MTNDERSGQHEGSPGISFARRRRLVQATVELKLAAEALEKAGEQARPVPEQAASSAR